MEDKLRCQSCGMPLGEGFFGTEADGSETQLYCKFCYQHGAFTNPEMTVDEMIALSVNNMINELHMPKEKAEELASQVIPQLSRWK